MWSGSGGVVTSSRYPTRYPSLAEDGFGPANRVGVPTDEERGPRVVFADGTQTIFLADLSGDGLTDLARIRNGEVCYWPNLGYGRFGAKVTMDDAPWFDAHFPTNRLKQPIFWAMPPSLALFMAKQSHKDFKMRVAVVFGVA